MVRVLHVLGRTDIGGAENVIMELYRRIDRTRLQFDFVVHTYDKCAYDDEIESLGGHVYHVPQYNVLNTAEYVSEWKKLLEEHPECNIIHSHVRSSAACYLPIAHRLGRYTIIHSHNTSSGKGIQGLTKNLLQLPLRNMADYYLACSEQAGQWLFGKKVCASDKFRVMHNVIDSEKFAFDGESRKSIREEFGLGDSLVVGNVGSFKEQKNHRFLIKIFREIYSLHKDSYLMLVGDGELKDEIKALAEENGISDRVIFTGIRGDVNKLFSAMDIFLLPSLYEGFSVALLEAQCAGLTVLASYGAVAKGAELSPLIEKISLDQSPEYWAQRAIENYSKNKRTSGERYIIGGGYDINSTYKEVERFYLERANEK